MWTIPNTNKITLTKQPNITDNVEFLPAIYAINNAKNVTPNPIKIIMVTLNCKVTVENGKIPNF